MYSLIISSHFNYRIDSPKAASTTFDKKCISSAYKMKIFRYTLKVTSTWKLSTVLSLDEGGATSYVTLDLSIC